jgi:hypothetical protein
MLRSRIAFGGRFADVLHPPAFAARLPTAPKKRVMLDVDGCATPPRMTRGRHGRRRKMTHDVARTRNLVPIVLLAFAATLALLNPWSRGPANAVADDPTAAPANANAAVADFQPALPQANVVPANDVPVGEASVSARFERTDQAGRIVVDLKGPASGKAVVHCRVSLRMLEFPNASPMMRMLPEPKITVLFTQDVLHDVGAGETKTLVLPVAADKLPPLPPEDPMASMNHAQVTVEALDA